MSVQCALKRLSMVNLCFQGKPFWTRYVITFRSFTVKHGVIKQMNIDSPKFENLIDQAFIFIHEQFVDGKFDRTESNFP